MPRACLILLAVTVARPGIAGAEGKILFNRDIRPILSENCFLCHGPDSSSRQADLRLDVAEAARAVIKPDAWSWDAAAMIELLPPAK